MVFHKSRMRVVMDTRLTRFDSIYGGGGTRTRLLELKVSDVIRLNDAILGDITE
jgi:prolyl-tRNA editing enzyme YbaK/EbsC (Cys-tRNA(Pro) deacylase)